MSEDFYKNALDSSFDGILIADTTGLVVYVNNQYEQITGIKAKDILHHNLNDLLQEGTINRAISLEVLKTESSVSGIHTYVSGKSAFSSACPILDKEKNVVGVINNTRNIDDLLALRDELQEQKASREKVHLEITQLRKIINTGREFIFASKAMKNTVALAKKVAQFDSTVMIYGESGTGKEVLSRYVHNMSIRAGKSFIKVNCAAIPKDLFESELFGYEKGAFTGASQHGKIGFFELADGGTLFLDEIGELDLSVQSKILRAIQEREIRRIGGKEHIKLDIRLIAATNRKLEQEVQEGRFREDLFFRLNVFPITIPPLRERQEDIPECMSFFMDKLNQKYKTKKTISHDAYESLRHYHYPGNVRELENIIEYLFILSENVIKIETIPGKILSQIILAEYQSKGDATTLGGLNYLMDLYEKTIIEDVTAKYSTLEETSKVLGIHYSTLSRKMHKHTITFAKKACDQEKV